jgi:hypothetical protein
VKRIALVCLIALPLVAAAAPKKPAPAPQPPPAASEPERPWARGVAKEDQDRALALFKEGNQLFEESQHAEALAKYRAALAAWDHPAIRYNTAVALIHLNEPLDAFDNLERALVYGDQALGAETYAQALTYKKLLLGQLAELQVGCDEAGAEVMLDRGTRLFVGPGKASRRLVPGPHQLVARKAGFLTETRTVVLLPGKPLTERIVLQRIRTETKPLRKRAWFWTVLVGSVAVAATGVALAVKYGIPGPPTADATVTPQTVGGLQGAR